MRIEGHTERTSAGESAAVARSRPRGIQLSALASPQSQVIASRRERGPTWLTWPSRYGDAEVPVPGEGQVPGCRQYSFEFWRRREDRLHDRLVYTVRERPGHCSLAATAARPVAHPRLADNTMSSSELSDVGRPDSTTTEAQMSASYKRYLS